MAAADGFFRCVYECCMSSYDTGIERRPYHRNCSCALHNKSRSGSGGGGGGNHPSGMHKCRKNVSYPIRRSFSEGSLVLAAAHSSSSPSSSSPCSSPKIMQEDHHDDNIITTTRTMISVKV